MNPYEIWNSNFIKLVTWLESKFGRVGAVIILLVIFILLATAFKMIGYELVKLA